MGHPVGSIRRLGGRFLLGLFLLDGIVGAVIAYVIFELNQAARLQETPADKMQWLVDRIGPSLTNIWSLIWLPAFCATLVLLPWLLSFLARVQGDPPVRYWLKAGAAGIGFGLLACVAAAFFQPICMFVAALPVKPDQWTRWLVVLLAGPVMFAFAGIKLAMMYFPSVVAAGIGFGLMNGAIVRWRLASKRLARADLSE